MSVFEGMRAAARRARHKVTLTIIRGSATDPHVVELTREATPAADVTSRTDRGARRRLRARRGDRREDRRSGEGADLPSSTKSGATTLIVDVRRTSGGSLDAGLALARLFVGSGTLAVRETRGTARETIAARSRRRRDHAADDVLVDNGTSGAAELFASALVGNKRAELIGEHTIGRAGAAEADQAARRQRPLAHDHALPHARRHAAPREGPRARRRRSTSPTSSSASRRRPPIPSSTRRSSGRDATPEARLRTDSVILTVRLTPVFSRCRRVAQRLERLLDTQEVGGSSPPVPTIEARCLALTNLIASRHEPGHRHASRWIQSGRCPPARACATWRKRSRRAWRRRRSPASWTASWSIWRSRSSSDASVRIVTDRQPRSAAALPPQHGAPAGGGGDEPVPRRAVRHRSGDRRRLLLRLRRARARSCPRTSRPSSRRCASSPSQDLVYERQMWPRDEAKAFFAGARRAAQGAADRGEDRGPARGLLLHDQGQGDLHRLLRRPARAVDGQAEGVQAAQHVERVLEGRRAQPADAAHLRHGVLLRQGAEGAPHADRGGEEARPPQARQRARAVHVPPVGAGRRVLAATRARRSTTRSPTTCATCSSQPATSR